MSENQDAEKCAWKCVSVYTSRSHRHSSIGDSKIKKLLLSLIGLTASGRLGLVFCSKCCTGQDVCCGGQVRRMATVATSAMTRNSSTKKTLLKVTMSMMTTMTTVLHRDFQNDWSSFPISCGSYWCSGCSLVFTELLPFHGLGCIARCCNCTLRTSQLDYLQ